jgi:hypothetical protein
MRVRGNVAERPQEWTAPQAEQFAQAVEAGQLFRVHLHFDRFDAGRGVQAHGVSPWWCGLRGFGRLALAGGAGQLPRCNFLATKKPPG